MSLPGRWISLLYTFSGGEWGGGVGGSGIQKLRMGSVEIVKFQIAFCDKPVSQNVQMYKLVIHSKLKKQFIFF